MTQENTFLMALEKAPDGRIEVVLNPEALDYPEAAGEMLHAAHLYLAEAFLQTKQAPDFMASYSGVTSGYTDAQQEWVEEMQNTPTVGG